MCLCASAGRKANGEKSLKRMVNAGRYSCILVRFSCLQKNLISVIKICMYRLHRLYIIYDFFIQFDFTVLKIVQIGKYECNF